MTILIPAYDPGLQFLMLIEKLSKESDSRIVVVNDGSGSSFENIFKMAEERGCTVLAHDRRKGRGRALKNGFEHILQSGETEGVVCVDYSASPRTGDVFRIADRVREYRRRIILGCRQLPQKVPARIRLINSLSQTLVSYVTGESISDTQSGLRGFSADMIDWLCHVPGERLDYEMNMLAEAHAAGYSLYEEMLEAPCDEGDFRARSYRDLIKISIPIIRFSASGVVSGILDFILLLAVHAITKNLLAAVVTARVCSSVLNYILNGLFVFNRYDRKGHHQSVPRYFILAAIVMLFNYLLMNLFSIRIGIPLVISKLLTEAILFIFSYWSQRKFVY